MTRIVGIVSGKGGTGKTTLAVNLGSLFSQLSHDTLVVDADIDTPNVGMHIGAHDCDKTLHDVLLGKEKMHDAIFFHHPSSLKFVPGHLSIHKRKLIDAQSLEKLSHLLDGLAPVVLLDCSSGVTGPALHALRSTNEVIAVTTPNLPAVLDTLKTIKAAEEHGIFVRGVVLNRVQGQSAELTKEQVSSLLEAPVIAIIPEDENMISALRITQPIVVSHPQSRAAQAMKAFAETLIG